VQVLDLGQQNQVVNALVVELAALVERQHLQRLDDVGLEAGTFLIHLLFEGVLLANVLQVAHLHPKDMHQRLLVQVGPIHLQFA